MFPSRRYLWLLAGDAVCLVFSFFWVTLLRHHEILSLGLVYKHVLLFSVIIPMWLWVFHMCGFYEWRYHRRLPSAILATGVFISFMFSSMLLYFISGTGIYQIPTPKVILLLASILSWALLFYWRDRAAVWMGLRAAEDIFTGASSLLGEEFLVLDHRVLADKNRNGYHERLREAGLRGVPVLTDYSLEIFKTGRIPVDDMEPGWLVDRVLSPNFTNLFYRVAKRALDMAVAVLLLPVALPVGLAVVAWLLVFMGWPVIYRQKRVGRGRKEFTIWKFRTMKGEGKVTTGENDPRVPASVRWIRRLHLDELPQLVNILKGEMSWVGPRPEQISVTDGLENKIPYYWVRHVAPPGLTGWAQVNMGYAGNFDTARERFSYDLYYLANRSVVLDMAILLRTLRSVITADGR